MKFLFFLFVLFWALNLEAQVELSSTFNSTYSGRNVSLTLSKTINGKHELGGGILFNINKLEMSDDQNKMYMKRMYATEFLHHFGVQGFYHYHILESWEHVHPFLFYNLQATYSKSRYKDAYDEPSERFGPFTWVEQYIGIGFKADFPGNFFITQKIGAGTAFILGKEERIASSLDGFASEFGSLISVGIGYRF